MQIVRSIFFACAATALFTLAGCASSAQMQAAAAANQPITVNVSKAKAKEVVATMFSSKGYRITKDSDFVLEFSAPTSSPLAQMLLSSRFSSEVDARISVQFTGDNPTTVIWHAYLVTNPGTGFEQLTDVSRGADAPTIQANLDQVLLPLSNWKPTTKPQPTKAANKTDTPLPTGATGL